MSKMTQLTPSHFHVNKKRAHDNRYFAAGVNVKSSSIFLKTTSYCLVLPLPPAGRALVHCTMLCHAHFFGSSLC